jgi:hypothetical protein
MQNPEYDKSKNNIILMNFFLSGFEYKRPDNPLGWTLNSPGWEKSLWKWHHKPFGMKIFDKTAIHRIYGVYSDLAGPPANWIKPFAQKNINDMKRSNATAMIVWQVCCPKFSNTNYRPEMQYFPEDLEERLRVSGKIRNWDWAVADIIVKNQKGEVLLRKSDVELHAADTEKLMFRPRFAFRFDETRYPLKQRLMFSNAETTDAAKKYVEKASLRYEYKFRDHKVIAIKFDMPLMRKQLLGKSPGESVELKAYPVLNDRELAKKPLTVSARIKGVKRAVIDIWAKMLSDAGVEFGFETTMHLTVGPAWQQYFQRLGFNSSWQYDTVKERIQWLRERFGKNCRWFYMDVFGTHEPQFVSQMLRHDYPDCFFFFEFDNDIVLRNVQSMHRPRYPLIDYIAPDSIGAANWLQWEPDDEKVRQSLKPFWKNPNYMIFTHGAEDKIVRLMTGDK